MSKEAVAYNPMRHHNGSGTPRVAEQLGMAQSASRRFPALAGVHPAGEMTTFSMTEREGDIRVLMEG
jgi:hypothetical protein